MRRRGGRKPYARESIALRRVRARLACARNDRFDTTRCGKTKCGRRTHIITTIIIIH